MNGSRGLVKAIGLKRLRRKKVSNQEYRPREGYPKKKKKGQRMSTEAKLLKKNGAFGW